MAKVDWERANRRAAVPRTHGGRRSPEAARERARWLYKNGGMTVEEISQRTGIKINELARIVGS